MRIIQKFVERARAGEHDARVVFIGFIDEKGDALADIFAKLRNIAQIQYAVGGFVEQFARNINNLLGARGLHPRRVFFVEKAGDDFKG